MKVVALCHQLLRMCVHRSTDNKRIRMRNELTKEVRLMLRYATQERDAEIRVSSVDNGILNANQSLTLGLNTAPHGIEAGVESLSLTHKSLVSSFLVLILLLSVECPSISKLKRYSAAVCTDWS